MILKTMLKGFFKFIDRTYVEDVEKEFESAAKKYELVVSSLNAEIQARKILLTALDQAEKFYRNQRKDVKKVVYVSRDDNNNCMEKLIN